MVRLRNALMAFVLATGLTGCSAFHGGGDWMARWSIFHCDSCDDFPAPAYGPDYSMMPGTYTGTTPLANVGSAQPAASDAPAGAMPATTPPAGITTPPAGITTPPAGTTTPPSPPSATPGPGSDAQKD
jgi:hypothetical protein